MPRPTQRLSFLLPVLVLAFACACGSKAPARNPSQVPAAATAATPSAPSAQPSSRSNLPVGPGYDTPPSTGVAEIDRVVAAFAKNDVKAVESLLTLQEVTCGSSLARGTPALCASGVAIGTYGQAITIEACDAVSTSGAMLHAYIQSAASPPERVFAVYTDTNDSGPVTEIVLALPERIPGRGPTASLATVVGGRVTKLTLPCAPTSPAAIVANVPRADFLIPPP